MKKSLLFALSLLVVASMVLTACGSAETPVAEAPATEEAPKFTCALITPNPLGDRSFIDASARGIEKANAELPVKCDIIENRRFVGTIRWLTDPCRDSICCKGGDRVVAS